MENMTKRVQQICKVITLLMKTCCIILLVVFCTSIIFIICRNSFRLPPEQFNAILFNSVFAGLQSLFLFVIFSFAYRIFRDISKEYTPFLVKTVKRMKRISALIIVWGIVSPLIFLGLRKIIPIESAFTISGIGRIFVGVLIYCFAVIFEYACLLQQQSDETM